MIFHYKAYYYITKLVIEKKKKKKNLIALYFKIGEFKLNFAMQQEMHSLVNLE